jgi:uncharacterized membrane protein
MSKARLEAFSDGVLAILITIMVLDLKVPHGSDLDALRPVASAIMTYVLSFVYIGIYWNNHHHMLHMTGRINGAILWANLHLLFWLSLVPFTTGWMGEHCFAAVPVAIYGFVLFCAGVAYLILQNAIIAEQGQGSRLKEAVGPDLKGKASAVAYLAAIALSFAAPWASCVLYVGVALMWLVPDRRIESRLSADAPTRGG